MPEYQIGELFLKESQTRFTQARNYVNHCLNQLHDEDMWWSPDASGNSIGIILQHVCGNLKQWILSGVGGTPDTRNRPQEFVSDNTASKADLHRMFSAVFDEVLTILENLPPERLTERAGIQDTDQSLLGAVYVAITHLDMHVGQILYLTRLRKGAAYEAFRKPTTPEQRK